VSAIAEPRLGGGIAASVLFHGMLVAAFFLLRPGAPPPTPPLYRVQLFAAPPGERAIGVVQDQPAPTPPQPKVEKPKPLPKPVATKPVPKATPKAVVPVKQATPMPPAKVATPPKEDTPQPVAGGGETGGKGADVSNLDTGGLEFNYPAYTQNIIRQLILAWGQGAPRQDATVRFTIRRDGTVDPESIRIVTPNNYSNDRRALGAVEQVADAKLFGPLPAGFREDILPVTVRFTPAMFK
jgi:periplasmic protein TonB